MKSSMSRPTKKIPQHGKSMKLFLIFLSRCTWKIPWKTFGKLCGNFQPHKHQRNHQHNHKPRLSKNAFSSYAFPKARMFLFFFNSSHFNGERSFNFDENIFFFFSRAEKISIKCDTEKKDGKRS
jgi:hypothetical protein